MFGGKMRAVAVATIFVGLAACGSPYPTKADEQDACEAILANQTAAEAHVYCGQPVSEASLTDLKHWYQYKAMDHRNPKFYADVEAEFRKRGICPMSDPETFDPIYPKCGAEADRFIEQAKRKTDAAEAAAEAAKLRAEKDAGFEGLPPCIEGEPTQTEDGDAICNPNG